MSFPKWGRWGLFVLLPVLWIPWAIPAQAGGESWSAVDFAKSFLEKFPRFHAEGIMTSTLVGKPPYHCRVEMDFDKTNSLLFAYNTDAAKNIIPYDYAYSNHVLVETIYDRERTNTIKRTEIGAPLRTLFNFVWNVLYEAEHGVGLSSLVANGLMSIDREDAGRGTKIVLRRRIPTGPVDHVVFLFDEEERLRTIEITQGDGAKHRIDIRKFRLEDPVETKPEGH